jgi:hypothetical protein
VSVALVIQHAKRMRLVILSAACPAVPYRSTLSRKRYDFRKTAIEYKICVLIFLKILPETFLILTIIQRDINIKVNMSDFNES